jgi:photosystem II stability/assembly factor-like uncharacterized protein
MSAIPDSIPTLTKNMSSKLRIAFTCFLLPGVAGTAAAAENDAWTIAGPPGASVYAIAPAPSIPSVVYIGTGRGVWRGERGGARWSPASTGLPVARVQTVAVDPGDPNTLYAGTLTPSGTPSVGIFKSENGGASWFEANAGLFDPFTLTEPLDVAALSIDPSNPEIILAGTRFSEIFRSENGGDSWTPQTLGGFGLSLETTAFARDPGDSRRIYAASSQGLLLSIDGGDSWSFFGNAGISFFCVAVEPAAAQTIWAGNLFGFGVGRSTDGGATWSPANGNLPQIDFAGQSFHPPILAAIVDPAGSAVTIATDGFGIFRSTDGGTTWIAQDAGLDELSLQSLAFLPGSSTLLAGGSGGGVYRNETAGGSWSKSTFGLNEALVSAVVANPGTPGLAYAAAYDGVYATGDSAGSWQRASGGLPPEPVADLALRFVVSIQPGDTETLYAATLGAGLWASTDGGATWNPRGSGLDDDDISSIEIAPSNVQTLYAGTDHPYDGSNPQRVYRSNDAGATWQRTGLDGGGFPIGPLAIDPDDAEHVAAISRGAGSYLETFNGGTTWQAVAPGGGCGGVNALLYLPAGDSLLVGATNGVCRSENGGTTWTHVDVAPFASVFDLLVDPDNPAVLYAAASPALPVGRGGVFRSADGGATWTPFGTGLETYAVRSLALDASGDTLYAGLRGGVAALPLEDPVRTVPEAVPSDHAPRVLPPRE